MDRQVSEKLEAEAIGEAAKIQKAHLKIVANLTGRLMSFLKNNPDAHLIESMQDFERLIKSQLLLTDKPTEIIDQPIVIISAVPSSK